MQKTSNRLKITLLSLVLLLVVLFLTQTSEDPHWGAGYWDQWLIGHFHCTIHKARQIVFWLRKTMHVLGYGVLGLVFWYYFTLWRLPGSFWLGIGATVLVAIGDEHMQALTTFRTGKPEDVLLDVCGAFLFCSLYWILGKQCLLRKKP